MPGGLPGGHLRLVGLVGLTDPLHPSAQPAVAAARAAAGLLATVHSRR